MDADRIRAAAEYLKSAENTLVNLQASILSTKAHIEQMTKNMGAMETSIVKLGPQIEDRRRNLEQVMREELGLLSRFQ